jgi:uncharacterized HAD superfamily protein
LKKIYVDFDDVLCETARSLLKIANKTFGTAIKYEEIIAFNPVEIFKITHDQVNMLLKIAHQPESLSCYQPTPHAPSTLSQLNRQGYEIHIVTGRPPYTRLASEKWLVKHQIPFHEIHFANKYARKTSDYNDSQVISMEQVIRMDFEFAIEDSAEMAQFISDKLNIQVFLMDRPWNKNLASSNGIFRCFNWLDIIHKINQQTKSNVEDCTEVSLLTQQKNK